MDSLIQVMPDSIIGLERVFTSCSLYVSHKITSGNVEVYRLWKSWTYDPNAIPFPDWGAGLTHITIDHHLAAVTLGLMLVCVVFTFIYGRIR